MKLRYFLAASLLTATCMSAGAQSAPNLIDEAGSTNACISSAEMSAMLSTDAKNELPNYSEPPQGGTRVQMQHPDTFMFAHLKMNATGERFFASCSYFNHVGLVSHYIYGGYMAPDLNRACTVESCAGQTYWREEFTDSIDKNPASPRTLKVCMKSVNGRALPSTKCRIMPQG